MLRSSIIAAFALTLPLWPQATVTASAQETTEAKPVKVLFIGNSYTYFNNLPVILKAIAVSQKGGPRIETEASLQGGRSLQWHWENARALEAIRRGGWDFVVLQEHSLLGRAPAAGAEPAVNEPAGYFEYAAKFAVEIKAAGARPVLYATWAREGFPEQQRRLDDAFTRVARQIDAILVPAGLAWTIVRIETPSLKLHMPDRSHPTMAGSYLNALLFYRCLTGRPAANAPATITGQVWSRPETETLVQLPLSDAQALGQIARRAADGEPLCPGRQP